MPQTLLQALPLRIFGIMQNDTLLAVPFFTFMGLILERSGMAEDLLDTIGQLFGPLRGGLATLDACMKELIAPHVIMRRGLIAGALYPRFVGDIATFMARTLFFSSDLALPAAKKKEGIAAFAGNHALCKITEDLIFTDPYRVAEQNRWTQPWLDATAAAFREDLDLHAPVCFLLRIYWGKIRFLGCVFHD